MIRVLFVCAGNICRSPMAEAVFRHLVEQEGLETQFEIDSAAVGAWHVGERPHRGTLRVLADRHIAYDHRARQLAPGELVAWDYVVGMDRPNLSDLRRVARGFTGELGLLLDYAPEAGAQEIPDPYYDGRFEEVYNLVEKGCRGLLRHIRQREAL